MNNSRIETVYEFRVDLHIDTTLEQMDLFYERCQKSSRCKRYKDTVYSSNYNAGPCWTAFLIAKSQDLKALQLYEKKVNYIAKRLKIVLE